MLKKIAFNATLWSGTDILIRQGLQFITLVFIARTLSPSDFGLIAMLSFLTGLISIIADGGLTIALIQKKEVTRADESTLLYFNIAIGSTLTVLMFLCAPWIAHFYESPDLIPLARIMSFSCILGSLAPVHLAILTRNLNFTLQTKASAFSSILSSAISIILTQLGFGLVALALYGVLSTGFMSLALWQIHPWRPRERFSMDSLKNLARFGFYQSSASLMEFTYSRIYTPLLGRFFGARELGLYSQADMLRQLPGNFIGSIVSRVALPLVAQNIKNPQMLRRGFQLSIRTTMFLSAPLFLNIAVLADLLLISLFGPHWVDAAPVLSILCLASLFFPLHILNVQALYGLGHPRLVLQLQFVKLTVGLLILALCAPYGIYGVAWGQLILSVLSLFLNTLHIKKFIGYGLTHQLADFAPPVALAAFTSCIVLAWRHFHYSNFAPLEELILGCTLGMISYFSMALALRLNSLRDTISIGRRVI